MNGSKYWMVGITLVGCSAPDGTALSEDSIASVGQELIGTGASPTTTTRGDSFVLASGLLAHKFINTPQTRACSATLVAPDKILTAQHCFDEISPTQGTWNFVLFDQTQTNQFSWQVVDIVLGNRGQSDDDDDFTQDLRQAREDVAVGTLVPNSGNLPTDIGFQPVQVSFDNPDNLPDGVLDDGVWGVGYGAGPRTACRIGPYADVQEGSVNGVKYLEHAWAATTIDTGILCEGQIGDSGGGLFVNVDRPGSNPVLVGTFSQIDDDANFQFWAATGGATAAFLWPTIGLPPTLSEEALMAGTAVFGRSSVRINDRAHVVRRVGDSDVGAPVVSGDYLRIGVDAATGDAFGAWTVLENRSLVQGDVRTDRLTRQNDADVSGQILQGRFNLLEEPDFDPGFQAGSGWHEFPPQGSIITGLPTPLSPGQYGTLVLRAQTQNQPVVLSAGVYVFDKIVMESNSRMVVENEPGQNTWIFVTGDQATFRGRLEGPAARILVGVPSASWVVIGDQWNGTLVAPNSNVVADMVTGAVLRGAFVADRFELHQGRFLFHESFFATWHPSCNGDDFSDCS